MTVMAAHEPARAEHDLLEVFLGLDTPDGYRAELIEGEIAVSPPPSGDHEDLIDLIVDEIRRRSRTRMQCSGHKGLAVPRSDGLFPPNHLIPDVTVAPRDLRLFRGAPSWMEPDGVAMVVEVTSGRAGLDRIDKRYAYAQGGIPLYLLVDRDQESVSLFSEPLRDDYKEVASAPFGEVLPLPEPFGFELDTADFL
ncbi:Uma2 family endonuclease [Streptomyces sp. NPDC127098]|uniref:Uma2 family endonuclease n=1 Tax=Streptomyces sp. NPDC127098 TaxID=3347137 RepID=UPI00366571CE